MAKWSAPVVGQTYRVDLDEVQGFIGVMQGLHGYHKIVYCFDTSSKESLDRGSIEITILDLGEKNTCMLTDEELEQLPDDKEEKAA